jgi:hypothetical protein
MILQLFLLFYGHEQSRVISGETLLIMLILVIIAENFMFILIKLTH